MSKIVNALINWGLKLGIVQEIPDPLGAFHLNNIHITLPAGSDLAHGLKTVFDQEYEQYGPTNIGHTFPGLKIVSADSGDKIDRPEVKITPHPQASAEQIVQSVEDLQRLLEGALGKRGFGIFINLPDGTSHRIRISDINRDSIVGDLKTELDLRRDGVSGRQAAPKPPGKEAG